MRKSTSRNGNKQKVEGPHRFYGTNSKEEKNVTEPLREKGKGETPDKKWRWGRGGGGERQGKKRDVNSKEESVL